MLQQPAQRPHRAALLQLHHHVGQGGLHQGRVLLGQGAHQALAHGRVLGEAGQHFQRRQPPVHVGVLAQGAEQGGRHPLISGSHVFGVAHGPQPLHCRGVGQQGQYLGLPGGIGGTGGRRGGGGQCRRSGRPRRAAFQPVAGQQTQQQQGRTVGQPPGVGTGPGARAPSRPRP